MVADALVYHPTVAHYLRFIATSAGRDKFFRTVQYFSRFYAWYLFRTNQPTRLIVPWEVIRRSVGTSRKLFNAGRNVESFKAAAAAYDSKNMDPVLKYCAVGRQLGYAMYLTLDTVTYLDASGIRPLSNIKSLNKTAYEAWSAGLIFNAISGLYTLWQLRRREQTIDKKEGEGVVESKKLQRERTATNLQLIADFCDLAITSTALGYANLDDGIVGLAGTISSMIGTRGAWKRTA